MNKIWDEILIKRAFQSQYVFKYQIGFLYFLVTRRPFLRERSGVLIEAPSQCLDLADYPDENRRDVQAYMQNNLTDPNLKFRLTNHHISEQEFCDRLTISSENNFMYLTQMMSAIAQALTCQFADNLDSEPFEYNQLPPALAAYYQQHLQTMLPPAPQQELSRALEYISDTTATNISRGDSGYSRYR